MSPRRNAWACPDAFLRNRLLSIGRRDIRNETHGENQKGLVECLHRDDSFRGLEAANVKLSRRF